MAAPAAAGHDVDETIRELKKIPGFYSFCILNNDGIVIKYENMSYKAAVHHAHLILSLMGKAHRFIRDIFDPPDVSSLANTIKINRLLIS